MNDLSDFLLNRRSVVVKAMQEPGPNKEDLEKILRTGMRVPDHGRLTPWRFIIIKGDAREKMGAILGEAFKKVNPDCIDEQIEETEKLPADLVKMASVLSQPIT